MRDQLGLTSIDVALLGAGEAAQARRDNLTDPLALLVLAELIPQATTAAGPVLMFDSLALGYDPAQLAAPPRLWRNLWDQAYGSRIVMPTPPDPLALAMTTVAATLFGNHDAGESREAALNALTALRPRITQWDPVPDTYTVIALGDAAIGPGWNARAQFQAERSHGRYAALVPQDGSPVLPITINLVKGSSAPDAARTLIAWLLSPPAQALIAQTLFYAPVNRRTDLSPATLSRAGAAPANLAHRMPMDWDTAIAQRADMVNAWRRHGLMGY